MNANRKHIKAAVNWLKRAQDATPDGGVSGWYSLLTGWAPSYVETTGYITSTFLETFKYLKQPELIDRAIKMADFLVGMQSANGSFKPEPRVFNTGQVILGLVDIFKYTARKKYKKSVLKAADWLVRIQERNGSWQNHTYGQTAHTYHTRCSWALLKAYEITKKQSYKDRAMTNLHWARGNQLKNGWFKKNGLPEFGDDKPFTHTISYALEGFLFSALVLKNNSFLQATIAGFDPILEYYSKNNFLPGTFDSKWSSQDRYSCLTGDAQLSVVSWTLFSQTRNRKYKNFATSVNSYLRCKQNRGKNRKTHGVLAGSDPVYGDILRLEGYSRFAYVNWAAKFLVDALVLEEKLKSK